MIVLGTLVKDLAAGIILIPVLHPLSQQTALRCNGPVVFFDDKLMYGVKGPVPQEEYLVPFGTADIKRQGKDVTVVATSSMVFVALKVADQLLGEGIEIEVVDPRTISPLDMDTILGSVRKTHRVLVVDEGHLSFGVTAEIASQISTREFDEPDALVQRYGAMDVPVPMSLSLEDETIPSVQGVVDRVREMIRGA